MFVAFVYIETPYSLIYCITNMSKQTRVTTARPNLSISVSLDLELNVVQLLYSVFSLSVRLALTC